MKFVATDTPSRRWLGQLRMGVASTLVLATVAAGFARRQREPEESRPVLLSTTGGGGSWSDIKELEAAAAKDNPRAWAALGEFKLKGEHTSQDIPQGLELLQKAARAGIASAAFSLGKAYGEGTGVKSDQTRSLSYFRAAAAGGVPEAFYNLGASYASGRGVRRDYMEGLAWLILATKAGVDSQGETLLRERLVKMKRTDLIEKALKRAPEIQAELAKGSVVSFLPDSPPPQVTPTPGPSRAPAPLPPPPSGTNPVSSVPMDRESAVKAIAIPPPPISPGR
ncbi:MAG: sel1 repeat family protein [Opitutaceae bacterium]|nr:sel1 repeat family protein [Opitutaceae bacterium]